VSYGAWTAPYVARATAAMAAAGDAGLAAP